MKKFFVILTSLLVLAFSVKAQQYVSTVPSNRNVILEEFTGRNCVNCPDGHVIANQIMANHPGHAWAINIHAGGFAPTTYPNLITPDSEAIRSGFGANSFPTGVINRSTADPVTRSLWTGQANQQLAMAAECNVAGRVMLNPDTRMAEITVEVYYTGNSTADENYLTVAMLQDSILGSQTGSNYNPAQVINGTYCHMHALRDIINTSTWGDAIAPTTQGTLITKTYNYEIPLSIGSPNGVEVNLNHIHFLAWVSERYQGTPTRPILNACELDLLFGTDEPIYPIITGVNMEGYHACTQSKVMKVTVSNIGTETLTSMVINASIEGASQVVNWEGTLPMYMDMVLEVPMEVPFGSHTLNLEIVEANGTATHATFAYPLQCLEWADLDIGGDSETLKLLLVQDKWGMQTTWEFTDSNGEVLASGGPYATLAGSTATYSHFESVVVPANECVMFTIHDSGENGICCASGDGFYRIMDSGNHLLVEGDGDFGKRADHLISVQKSTAVQESGLTSLHVYPNPAQDCLTVKGEMDALEVYNVMGQCLVSQRVNGDEAQVNLAGMSDGIYLLRVYHKGEMTVRKISVRR